MPLGKVLYESGDVLGHVYFPTDSIVSLLYVLEDGASAEISVVGNEGLIGVALFMGGETTPSRAIVQGAGHAYRLIRRQLEEAFHRHGEMADEVERLIYVVSHPRPSEPTDSFDAEQAELPVPLTTHSPR